MKRKQTNLFLIEFVVVNLADVGWIAIDIFSIGQIITNKRNLKCSYVSLHNYLDKKYADMHV